MSNPYLDFGNLIEEYRSVAAGLAKLRLQIEAAALDLGVKKRSLRALLDDEGMAQVIEPDAAWDGARTAAAQIDRQNAERILGEVPAASQDDSDQYAGMELPGFLKGKRTAEAE